MTYKILIIDDDVDTLKLVGITLEKQGYQIVVAASGSRGIFQAEVEKPDLIILDVLMPEIDGYEVARRLRANPQTSDTPILIFTAKTQLDDRVTGYEVGADDYLTKPIHPRELTEHVKTLLSRSIKDQGPTLPAPSGKGSFTIGILAARGGLGVTTVAINLGSSIHMIDNSEVIVVELRPGMGTLGLDLGIPNPLGLTRLLQAGKVETTRERVNHELIAYKVGLRLLVGSAHPSDLMLLENHDQVELIVSHLKSLAAHVILDMGSGLSKLNQNLAKKCDRLVVLMEPVPNTIMHTKALLTDITELGINPANIHAVVVNRIRSDTQMSLIQVQDKLEHPVLLALTPAPELIYQALQKKTIPVDIQPDSLTAQQFIKLATKLLDLEKKPT